MLQSPSLRHARRATRVASLAVAATLLSPSPAHGQDLELSFSVDWHGVLQGKVDDFVNKPMTPGDILRPALGTLFGAPIPRIRFDGGFLELSNYQTCLPLAAPGVACGIEVDALSFGLDQALPSDPHQACHLMFTTDEYAQGIVMTAPSVSSEAPIGDSCGDVFVTEQLPVVPLPPQTLLRHAGMIDGDGKANANGKVYPGIGIFEPNVPGTGLPGNSFDPGDNIDAFDVDEAGAGLPFGVFFSVDGSFNDPFAGVPNSGTDQAQNVSSAAVVHRRPGGGTVIYATPAQLGLDQNGPSTDDLDALIIAENGVQGYQPSLQLFDWENSGASRDMLLFSVRRGSEIIDAIDSLQGLKISEGDILGPPLPGGNGNPAIIISAESMGLQAARSGGSRDDLNGGDLGPGPWRDCNDNGVHDSLEIQDDRSLDMNENGILDDCEELYERYCFCTAGGGAPCGNPDPDSGCANSTGEGANLGATGSTSMWEDDLVIMTTQAPPNKFGMFFLGGDEASAPIVDGIRCVGPGVDVGLIRLPPQAIDSSGAFSRGPGMIQVINNKVPGTIIVGRTIYIQAWYRDGAGSPCGAHSNLTNGLEVTFSL